MIKDYQLLLDEIETAVLSMGFKKTHDDEFEAIFSNDSGWTILFEGERYVRPAFELSVGKDCFKFSVRLLMAIFNVDDKPSLSRQLKFISEKYKDVFVTPPPYLLKYEKANEVDI